MSSIRFNKIAFLGIAFPLLMVCSPFAHGATPKGGDSKSIQLMFVQTSKEVEFSNNKMILKGVSPSTIFFSDRPERVTGHLTLPAFLQEWDQGKDSFAKDPPNATLSIFSDKGVQYVVVELMNPVLDGQNLTYDVRILDGNPPAKGGISSLFIDWWSVGFGPPGPGYCHRNWYTGALYCYRPGYWNAPPYWRYY